ncbi:polysaccharide biosynthesis/export family protein [bacterium]|nr:polysaccharide biosynthesis/export family protein [bacterium]
MRVQVHELKGREFAFRDLDLSRDYPINPEGYIVMPLIGQVKVKGYTVYEVTEALKERFSQYLQDPYVYVRPLIRLTLQGAFNEPGAYHVDPTSSVWDVVELAGGPDKGCDLAKMRVERGGKVVIPNVLEAFEQGISLEEVGIESGDQLLAPMRGGIGLGTLMSIFNLFASMVLVYLRLKQGSI